MKETKPKKIERIEDEIKREARYWFGVHETTESLQHGGIVDYEVKITKLGFEEFVLPKIIKFIESKVANLKGKGERK